MRSVFKWSWRVLLTLLLILNLFILFTGRTYLYKGVWNTYLQGRTTASIDEYVVFENRVVAAAGTKEWPVHSKFNSGELSKNAQSEFQKWGTIAWVIIKDDSLCHEQYWQGYSDTSHTGSFSIAKSFISILTGIALKEGKIKSLDQSVGDFLPEYSTEPRSKITIKHLLTMSSGIGFNESYKDPLGFAAEAYYGSDLRDLIFRYEPESEPGQAFKYLSGNTQLLSFVLKEATGMSVSEYASEKLWKPVQAGHSAFWSLDHKDGDEKAYCCFNSNAKDFARIGQLYLDSGRWNGVQIVPEEFVLASIKPTLIEDADLETLNNRYGYSWWLLPAFEYPLGSGIRKDIFYARGILGQYIIVIPKEQMVIVRLGRDRSRERVQGHPKDLFTYIQTALDLYGN